MALVTYPLNNIEYSAEDAELFHVTRTSGIYANDSFNYSVSGTDNTVVIGTGIGWIKNSEFSGKVIALKEATSLEMGLPDSFYPRIDAIIIQFDANNNETNIVIKKGTAASTPVAPSVVQTESVYELHLYHVRRDAGSLYITTDNITDLRLNNSYCGLMTDSITKAVDKTLKLPGVAADAAAVGVALEGKAPAGFGLGSTNGKVVTDANNATNNGWYTIYNGGSNLPGSSYGGAIHVKAYPTKNVIQHLYYTGHRGGECRRICTDGTWGEWEFVTPPLYYGIEFRTTERWNGKAVYTKLVDCGAFPSGGTKKDREIGSGVTKILRVEGTSANSGFTVPYTDNTACVHISATLYQGIALIILYVEKGDLTADSCIAQIWYTKD